jgi:hypothetical protein
MKYRLCLVLLALTLANTALPAAETTAPTATASAKTTVSPTPAMTPIPLPDIVAEATSAKRVLADINSALAAAAMKTAVFPGLSNLERDIDKRTGETKTIIANGPAFDVLDELLGIWQALANNTINWNRDLTQRATELVWTKWRQPGISPPALRKRKTHLAKFSIGLTRSSHR